MSLFPSRSGSFMNIVSLQANSNSDGVPSRQDRLPSMLAILDTLSASPQISPSTDDPPAMSSESPHSSWDLDALPFADGYPDASQHHVDRLTELALTELAGGLDALGNSSFRHWNTSASNITLSHPLPHSSITSVSQQTNPDSIDILSRQEYHPMTLAIPDPLDPSLAGSPSDDNSSVLSSVSSEFTWYIYPIDGITWLAEATTLPMELLLDILEYLARDVKSLLACAFTCRRLRTLAQPMINKFCRKEIEIDATRYDDLDELVEWLRPAPKLGRSINTFQVKGTSEESIPVVLSVLPIRLSSLLISLRELKFKDFTVESQPYPSRWSLYGRAFPNLTKLELTWIRFPSLKDFVALITSFPALTTLVLVYLQLGSPVIPIFVEIFRPGFPALKSLNIPLMYGHDIPWVIAILSNAARSLQTMDLKICPTSENIDSFAWTCLDVVLSSWFMVNHTKHNSKLDLTLRGTRFKDKNHSIESLFPLTTSLGKDKWGTFY
ncbi:hypothetical protein NLI96_g3434 [Meripilus lineatus]|uniref:F-box domain-containing protein n=1 Tax=Meripilus lineatus TaxID=2056292 RepID=A0AAD5V716_9APHY|nr:hypothetical protein NLI96_g3434 [Physisporinus lineatus]